VSEILQDVALSFKAYLEGGNIAARTLIELEAGDVLVLDHGAEKPMKASLNGEPKWEGYIASMGENLAFEVTGIADTVPV
jgi:flagellar motor switch protein FliM